MRDVVDDDPEDGCPVCGGPTRTETLYVLGQVERICRNIECSWPGIVTESWGDDGGA